MKKTLLDGIWRLRADRIEDNKFAIKKGDEWDMAIPGDVHDTLISQSVIPDPYYGMNELDTLFVGRGDWSIERKFNWKRSEEKTFLRLEKVDTVARLFINGEKVYFIFYVLTSVCSKIQVILILYVCLKNCFLFFFCERLTYEFFI